MHSGKAARKLVPVLSQGQGQICMQKRHMKSMAAASERSQPQIWPLY